MWISLVLSAAAAEPEEQVATEELVESTESTTEDEADGDTEDEDDPAAEPEPAVTIAIPQTTTVFTSAMDDDTDVERDEGEFSVNDLFSSWQDERRAIWGASTYVRPTYSLLIHEELHPTQLGLTVGRRYWQLRDGPRASADIAGHAEFPLGQAKGSWDLGLATLGGAWLGPVGLQAGPRLSGSRHKLAEDDLPAVGAVDGVTQLIVDASVVQFSAGISPRWHLSEARPPASGPRPLDGLGDEIAATGGVGLTRGAMRLNADFTRRWTAVGTIDRIGFGIRMRLL